MIKNCFFRITVLLALAIIPLSDLLAETVEQILAMKEIPNMEVIERSSSNIYEREGIPISGKRLNFEHWLSVIVSGGPKFVAQLEYAYPGATFAFMGRDTQALAGLVEAFYLSIGQKDRVVRLGMSKGTILDSEGNLAVSDFQIVKFLKSNGFSFDHIEKAPPFILVDTVSTGGGTQGRTLLDAAYTTYWKNGGRNPALLLSKLNMLGLVVSTFNGTLYDFKNRDAIFDELTELYSRPSFDGDFFGRHKILMIPRAHQDFHEAGYDHFTGAWNSSYGPMRKDEYGNLRATIGAARQNSERLSVLWYLKRIQQAAARKSFLEDVLIEARVLGYEFPMARPAPKQISEADIQTFEKKLGAVKERMRVNDLKLDGPNYQRAFNQEIYAIIDGLSRMENEEATPSPNAKRIIDWVFENWRDLPQDLVGILLLEVAEKARQGKRITYKDMYSISEKAFEYADTTSVFYDIVRRFMDSSEIFKKMMAKPFWIRNQRALETYRDMRTLLDGDMESSCGKIFKAS
jgi:hypothetical protein